MSAHKTNGTFTVYYGYFFHIYQILSFNFISNDVITQGPQTAGSIAQLFMDFITFRFIFCWNFNYQLVKLLFYLIVQLAFVLQQLRSENKPTHFLNYILTFKYRTQN